MANLFAPEVYNKIALVGDRVPVVPRLILEYQSPKDAEAIRINDLLKQIFNDSQLHVAVRAYGKPISFAHHTDDRSYIGFHHLTLDPAKRMILARQELQLYADHINETEQRPYDLFQTENGIFYIQIRDGTQPGEPSKWKEAVLAANDIIGHEKDWIIQKRIVFTAEDIRKSLEETVSSLIK